MATERGSQMDSRQRMSQQRKRKMFHSETSDSEEEEESRRTKKPKGRKNLSSAFDKVDRGTKGKKKQLSESESESESEMAGHSNDMLSYAVERYDRW